MLRNGLLLTVLALAAAPQAGCALFALDALTDRTHWQAAIYTDYRFEDVFMIARAKIEEDDFRIANSDIKTGDIESDWDFDSVSPLTRYSRRERVVAKVTALEEGVELKLRVETQVRERSGLLGPDDRSNVGWAQAQDDVQRSELVFQKIHSALSPGRPSSEFYERPVRWQGDE